MVLWHAFSAWPDTNEGSAHFTYCGTGGTSTGNWPAMSSGDKMYFEVDKINDQRGSLIYLSVKSLSVGY